MAGVRWRPGESRPPSGTGGPVRPGEPGRLRPAARRGAHPGCVGRAGTAECEPAGGTGTAVPPRPGGHSEPAEASGLDGSLVLEPRAALSDRPPGRGGGDGGPAPLSPWRTRFATEPYSITPPCGSPSNGDSGARRMRQCATRGRRSPISGTFRVPARRPTGNRGSRA